MNETFQPGDADHLRLFADWFDQEQGMGRWRDKGFEVQSDLRRIADTIELRISDLPELTDVEQDALDNMRGR